MLIRDTLKRTGFTLLEVMLAVAIAGITTLATLGILGFARLHNSQEQERARAHQVVTQAIEEENHRLFTYTTAGEEMTIWDNMTPGDTSDDTVGTLTLRVENAQTGEVLTQAPDPAVMVKIEATLTWVTRGSKLQDKLMRESAMAYKVP
ncbi:MAG: type IV pilus modification PilV family protein [Candidatus Sumerlaeota bacterium]